MQAGIVAANRFNVELRPSGQPWHSVAQLIKVSEMGRKRNFVVFSTGSPGSSNMRYFRKK